MNYQQRYHDDYHGQAAGQNRMLGKVVLLVGNDITTIQTLVNQLTRKGADVALVCWHMPLDAGRKIKESVQAVGRHFLLLEHPENNDSSNHQVIETIISELGRLDLLIDLSAQYSNHSSKGAEDLKGFNQDNWLLTRAFLDEIA